MLKITRESQWKKYLPKAYHLEPAITYFLISGAQDLYLGNRDREFQHSILTQSEHWQLAFPNAHPIPLIIATV